MKSLNIIIVALCLLITGCNSVSAGNESIQHCDQVYTDLVKQHNSDQARYSFHDLDTQSVVILHFQDIGLQVIMLEDYDRGKCTVSRIQL